MKPRIQLEKRIQAKTQEILKLENEIREARSYIQGLQDALKMLPRDTGSGDISRILRPGSDMAKARDAMLRSGKPMHINEILREIGKDKAQRASVTGSLGNYVRKGEIFTRPAPNTFGLKEFDADFQPDSEPPDDFGIDKEGEA